MRKLVIGIFVVVALVAVILIAAPGLRGGSPYRFFKCLVALLAAASALRVAVGLHRGEHLRRAWCLLATDYGLIGVVQVVSLLELPIAVNVVVTVLINAAGVAATIYFARSYDLAGLDFGPPAGRRLVYATTAVLALLLVGIPFFDTLHHLRSGNIRVLIITVSSIGDLITFSLIGPILMTALAMRGGILVWPWALLVFSNVAWFLQDGASLATVVFPDLSEDSVNIWTNLWQVLACFLAFAAAQAQRRVSQGEASPDERPRDVP